MVRITKPDKWKDAFFLNLNPHNKLLFIYIYENCDNAGFFDLNLPKMSVETGVDLMDITSGLTAIEKAYLISENKDRIWLRKFLLHQNKLPLDLKSEEGNYIKFQIESNLSRFGYSNELHDILKNTKKRTRTKAEPFSKPTLNEVIQRFSIGEWSFVPHNEIASIYDYYQAVGWKVGRTKKMVDWVAAFEGCFRRNQHRYVRNVNSKNTRMDALIKENEKLQNFDYNTLV